MPRKKEREFEKRAQGELRYRLAKLLFLNAKAAGLVNDDEISVAKEKLLKKYKPLTGQLNGSNDIGKTHKES